MKHSVRTNSELGRAVVVFNAGNLYRSAKLSYACHANPSHEKRLHVITI